MLKRADGIFEFEACIGGSFEFGGHNVANEKIKKRVEVQADYATRGHWGFFDLVPLAFYSRRRTGLEMVLSSYEYASAEGRPCLSYLRRNSLSKNEGDSVDTPSRNCRIVYASGIDILRTTIEDDKGGMVGPCLTGPHAGMGEDTRFS